MSTPAERVAKYLAEYATFSNTHKELIHGLHTGVAGREAELTVSDLRALLDENRRLREALEKKR